MRVHWIAVGCLAAGCSSTAKGDDDDDDDDGCGFAEPDDLEDLAGDIPGDGHQCESQPQYDPEVPWLTVWFTGEFHVDDCGVVTGVETWEAFPNPLLRDEAGMEDCVIVYDVTGSKNDPVERGDYRLTLNAKVDADASTCLVLDGQPLYTGYEEMDLVYDVDVDPASGGAAFYFESGTLLGDGHGNASHASYLSDAYRCESYLVDF